MQLELFLDAADELAKRGDRFGVVAACKRQRIGIQEGAQEKGVLRDKGAEPVCLQCAIAESLHEWMREARLRQWQVCPPQFVMEHSAFPRHLPKLPLVREYFIKMLLRCLVGMSLGKLAKRRHISGKVRARPALNKLGAGARGHQGTPGSEVGGLDAEEDREQHRLGLGVGATHQEIGVPPAGWVRRDV